MGSRAKEDEKNEKIIRSLLKQSSNRRCINCNSMGPQYICLNFWTFVCTTCSGIHREFTHRVKSVSLSKFTVQEVSALQSGGNEKARDIYFKEWDPQRQPLPDSSNVDRLRDFIKSVYVDKRFSGERPPRGRGGDRDDGYEPRLSDPRMDYRSDSRSTPYEDRYEERRVGARHSNGWYDDRRYDDRVGRFNEKRSPGWFETDRSRSAKGNNENWRYDERGRHEIQDRHYEGYNEGLDRRLEERFTNEKRNTEIVHHQREFSGGSPPVVQSVKEVLGDDIPPLQVEDRNFHANGSKEDERTQDSRGQRFGSSSSFGSADGMAPVHKGSNLESLIDFSKEPDLSAVSKQPDLFGLTSATHQQTANTSGNTGWATFDTFTTAPVTVSAPEVCGGLSDSFTQLNGAGQWASLQTAAHPALYGPSPYGLKDDERYKLGGASQPSTSTADPSQAWNAFQLSTATTPQRPPTAMQTEATNSQQLLRSTASATGPQVSSSTIQQRQEIPEDLFTSLVPERDLQNMGLYMSGVPSFVPQVAAVGSMGYPGQIAAYVQPRKSTNPFDLPDVSPIVSIGSGGFLLVHHLKIRSQLWKLVPEELGLLDQSKARMVCFLAIYIHSYLLRVQFHQILSFMCK
eukprot:c27765_g1_i2 orf=138-2021(+)